MKENKVQTTSRIDRELLAQLKTLAVRERKKMNDIILEAIKEYIERSNRR